MNQTLCDLCKTVIEGTTGVQISVGNFHRLDLCRTCVATNHIGVGGLIATTVDRDIKANLDAEKNGVYRYRSG